MADKAMFFIYAFAAVAGFISLAAIGLLRAMMRNRTLGVQERQAWYMLGVAALSLLGYLILVGVLRCPWEPALGVFGVYGFSGLAGLIGRRERREGKVISDERDREIERRSTLAGYGVFWVVFVIAVMSLWARNPLHDTVTLRSSTLTFSIVFGMMIVFTVKSLVVIVMYRRDARGETN